MKNLTGKTVVIKYGGAAMVDERLRADVMSDIVLLKIMGMKPVIVHGGGKDINAALKRHEIPVEFRGGQRVTSNEAMELVREVLVGKVNGQLVSAVNQHGNLAVGVSGSDAGTIVAEQLAPELGRVGPVSYTHLMTAASKRPVKRRISPVLMRVFIHVPFRDLLLRGRSMQEA